MRNHTIVAIIGLMLLFVVLRLPGLALPYHQDEWKNAYSAEVGGAESGNLFHPPLTALLLQLGVALFGGESIRVLTLLFSVISAVLLWIAVERRAGTRAAHWSLFFYALSFCSVWASLMVDTDGAILPAFFLLSIYCYDRATHPHATHWWWAAVGAALLLGLLVKLSFVLVVGVLVLDLFCVHYRSITRRQILAAVGGIIGFGILFVAGLLLTPLVYPAFRLDEMISHALYFVQLSGRNYTQIVAQAIKIVMYLSPILVVPLVLYRRETFSRTRVFSFYVLLGCLFYFIIFDFSRGALDKYLLFLAAPLSAITGVITARVFSRTKTSTGNFALSISGVCAAVAVYMSQYLPHVVAPLYPKSEWFSRVLHGEWTVLTPFTGGSGPLGFYVSFLLIGSSFVLAGIYAALGLIRPHLQRGALIAIILISVAYNTVFIGEFSFGTMYGNAGDLLKTLIVDIEKNPTITRVITYNDIGAYELTKLNRYADRFYAAPQYEAVHAVRFEAHTGHYLVIDVPHINPDSFYGRFFSQCNVIVERHSGVITGTIYECLP